MLEIIVFVVAMAMANLVSAIIITAVMFKVMTSKWFIKKYMKMVTKMTHIAIDEVCEPEEEEA